MNTPQVSTIRIRPKHQITLPVNIVREAKISLDDTMEATYSNGVIVLKPCLKETNNQEFNIMSYAGIGNDIWGNTAEDINKYINELRA